MKNKQNKTKLSNKGGPGCVEKKDKRIKKKKSGVAKLPKGKEEASSNWKSLLEELKSERRSKGETRPKRSDPRLLKKINTNHDRPPNARKKKPDIWFDDVDEMLLDPEDRERKEEDEAVVHEAKGNIKTSVKGGLVKEKSFGGLTKVIGIDCEMVGVGYKGEDSILARISLVNHFGKCIYDKFVKPTEKVVDYRTPVSGIRPADISDGADFKTVQHEVAEILRGRVLVGHSLKHDLRVLFLDHPKRDIRDTASYKPFRAAFGGKTPSLKRVTERFLGVKVQEGEHSSVQDAQAAVRLYTMFRRDWERAIDERKKNRIGKTSGQKPDVNPGVTLSRRGSGTGQSTVQKAPSYQDSDDSD